MTQNFIGQINIGNDKYSYDLVFGFDNNSDSNIYNKKTDKYAPPTPPMNFFDAALGLNGERYYSKITKLTKEDIVFIIHIQVGDNSKINLNWDNINWDTDLEYCKIEDLYDGKLGIQVNMLKENNLEITNPLINGLKMILKKK